MARGAYISFEETTSDLSDNAFRVLCYLRNHMVKSDTVYPSIESMSEDLQRSTRTCKRAIAELKTAGFVKVTQAQNGVWEYTVKRSNSDPKAVTNLSPRSDKNGTGTVTNLSYPSDTHGDTDSDTHSDKFVIPPTPPYIGKETEETEVIEDSSGGSRKESKPKPPAATTTTINQNLEPFESGIPGTLPMVRNGVEPFRPRTADITPTIFRPEIVARIYEVLGQDGDTFARKVTQEQADAGFAEWILGEAAKNKTPGRLAFHLLKTQWHPAWRSPADAQRELEAELARRLEALT